MKSTHRGIELAVLEVLPDPEHDALMLATCIGVKELKHQRAAVCNLASPRPYELRVGVSGFDPAGPIGPRAALHLIVPARTYIGKATSQWPARRVGHAVRELARLYERTPGERTFTLEGRMENTNLSRLLTHLKDEGGGTLLGVDLVIRRTPKPSERDPIWTLYVALPGAIPWGPRAVEEAAE